MGIYCGCVIKAARACTFYALARTSRSACSLTVTRYFVRRSFSHLLQINCRCDFNETSSQCVSGPTSDNVDVSYC